MPRSAVKYLTMLISELLDNVLPYEWQTGDLAAFNTPRNHQGVVVFELYEADLAGAHVEFSIEDRYDITGSGHANAVFATVLKIIREYEIRNDISILFMESSEDNRTKLYKRIAHRLGYVQIPREQYQVLLQKLSHEGRDGLLADPDGVNPRALIFVHNEAMPQVQELS